jgi:hypothetical protein
MGKLRTAFPVGLILGTVLGFLGAFFFQPHPPSMPAQVRYLAPRLQAYPLTDEEPLAVEVRIDSNGRVQDYQVLPNSRGIKALSSRAKNRLIFTAFRPAQFMDMPVGGTAMLEIDPNY